MASKAKERLCTATGTPNLLVTWKKLWKCLSVIVITIISKKKLYHFYFQVTNEFGVPVAVHNLSLAFEATRYFNLITDGVNGGSGFEPVILQPGETKDLSFLSLKDEAWEDRILNSILTIHTNISNIHVPLLCFHGLIDTVSIIYRCF